MHPSLPDLIQNVVSRTELVAALRLPRWGRVAARSAWQPRPLGQVATRTAWQPRPLGQVATWLASHTAWQPRPSGATSTRQPTRCVTLHSVLNPTERGAASAYVLAFPSAGSFCRLQCSAVCMHADAWLFLLDSTFETSPAFCTLHSQAAPAQTCARPCTMPCSPVRMPSSTPGAAGSGAPIFFGRRCARTSFLGSHELGFSLLWLSSNFKPQLRGRAGAAPGRSCQGRGGMVGKERPFQALASADTEPAHAPAQLESQRTIREHSVF